MPSRFTKDSDFLLANLQVCFFADPVLYQLDSFHGPPAGQNRSKEAAASRVFKGGSRSSANNSRPRQSDLQEPSCAPTKTGDTAYCIHCFIFKPV